jgi:hypothetical protein
LEKKHLDAIGKRKRIQLWGPNKLISTSHNILPLVYYVTSGYLLVYWEFIWKNNIVHGFSFVESFLRCDVTCDANVQLKYQPNLHYCGAVRCDAEFWVSLLMFGLDIFIFTKLMISNIIYINK